MSKNFEELLKAIKETDEDAAATLAKAEAPESEDDDEDEYDGEGEGDDAAIAAAAAEEGGKPAMKEFGKSFEFTDAAGNKQQAVDATDLVKSLMERQEATDDTLTKALTTMTGTLQKQGELIKSMAAQIKDLSSQGRGRKTVLAINEKPDAGTLAKSEGASDGVTAEQFFAKAHAAFDAGKLTGRELTVIDVCKRSNQPIEQSLIQKVLSA